MSKEIQVDAQVIQRQAERGLGVAIRKGQLPAGGIRGVGSDTRTDLDRGGDNTLVSPTTYASKTARTSCSATVVRNIKGETGMFEPDRLAGHLSGGSGRQRVEGGCPPLRGVRRLGCSEAGAAPI